MPTPEGYFAKAAYESITDAEALQGQSVAYIREAFAVKKDVKLALETLTWETFMEKLTDANDNDEIDKFNENLIANILNPVIEQVMAEREEEA